jgi:hypothetical protein
MTYAPILVSFSVRDVKFPVRLHSVHSGQHARISKTEDLRFVFCNFELICIATDRRENIVGRDFLQSCCTGMRTPLLLPWLSQQQLYKALRSLSHPCLQSLLSV